MNQSQSNSITAIILAGGQSSRMGTDKALIQISGIPWLQKISTIATKYIDRVYIVTSRPERYQHIVPETCHFIREVSSSELNLLRGPLVGFACGLAKVNTEWTLLLACDLPLLNESYLKKSLNYLELVPNDAIATLPKSDRGWEPLSGFYRTRCLPLLQDFIKTGGRSFQSWLSLHYIYELPVSDRKILFNCNTPEDLEKLKKLQNF
ncbi:MAG: molybdenum cofactor guanylyltransferase [Prochloraceae cyanobacterium]|nr:molybdenum cofactor guanylyltransferase [Prochloraceae cyanobacterium]